MSTMQVNKAEKIEIQEVLESLHLYSIDFSKCSIDNELLSVFRNEISKTRFHFNLQQHANLFLKQESKGYIVIDFGADFDFGDQRPKTLIVLLSSILIPFGIFEDFGLWKEIGVDLKKEPNRSSGIGYNPFHIDFVNTTDPPLYSILFCEREDPLGGGQTIVSNFRRVIKSLSQNEIGMLKEVAYEEGRFWKLSNVGTELNPFPIIEDTGKKIIRFTSKIKSLNQTDFLIKKIESILIQNQDEFLLKRNQLVIFNQRVVCHGRLPLKGRQEEINQGDRRLLHQLFGKKYELSL